MVIKDVLKMGDERLLRRAEEVNVFDTLELHALLADMRDTMRALDGAGLAAPQIGVNLRVVIFGVEPLRQAASTGRFDRLRTVSGQAQDRRNPRYPDAEEVPQTVLINPVITPLSEAMEEGWEGCLSVHGLRGRVPRHMHLRYQGRDEYGALIDRTASGFHARVVQHENDHLDGILYLMRIRDLRNFGFNEVLSPDHEAMDE